MKRFFFIILIFFFISGSVFAKRIVSVSVLPQQFVTEFIAGDLWDVNVLVSKGASPHTYNPSPRQMIKFSKSDLYLRLGNNFEKVWLKKLVSLNDELKVKSVDTGIKRIHMKGFDQTLNDRDHSENGHNHKGENLDPHIWLSIGNLKTIAKNTYKILSNMDPENEDVYYGNYKKFLKKLSAVSNRISVHISRKNIEYMLVYHPSWNYFAKEFGIKQVAIEEGGKQPSPAHLKKIIDFVEKYNIETIFVQPQLKSSTVKNTANSLGVDIVSVDPLSYNIVSEFKKISDNLGE